MNKVCKRLMLVFLLCMFIFSFLNIKAWANSAEPPSVVILIKNPPKDLSITLVSSENHPEARVSKVAWEGYYAFYSRDISDHTEYIFNVTSNGDSFEVSIDVPLQGYRNVFTLDLSNRKLIPGKYPFRSLILVSIRVLLTLLLEGLMFLLFRFKQKRSWIIFIAINLFTQGILNIWLDSFQLLSSYLIIILIIGEFFVFVTEMILFPISIKEHKMTRILICVFVANIVSLIAGGYIISVLPV